MRKLAYGAAALVLTLAAIAEAHAETQLRAISFIRKNHPVMKSAADWVGLINKELKGKLVINYVGGPEIIGRFQQFDAVKNGVVDVVVSSWADIQDRLPGVASSWLSKCAVPKERDSGLFDYLAEQLAKLNIKHIGRASWSPFYLWVNRKPGKLADLKGLKMRTGSLYNRMMVRLGMVPVTVNVPETYTALQRGVADGFGAPAIVPRKLGWLEKVRYVIDLPFFDNSNMGIMMNMDRWKKLPADVQNKIAAVTIGFESVMVEQNKRMNAEEWKAIGNSVAKVTFSPEENKQFIDAAYETEWAELARRLGVAEIARLKKFACN